MRAEAFFWILIAVVFIFAVKIPRFRKLGFAIVGIAVLTVVGVIAINQRIHPANSRVSLDVSAPVTPRSKRVDFEQLRMERMDRDDPEAKDRIPISEVRFDQIRANFGPEPTMIESVQARLYNDSARFTLTNYAYYLTVEDCVSATCTTVYDQRDWAVAAVPPRQARDVLISIRDTPSRDPPTFKLLGTAKIAISATDTRAYKSAVQP